MKIGIGFIGFGTRARSLEMPMREKYSHRVNIIGFCENGPIRYETCKKYCKANGGEVRRDIEEFLKLPGLDLVMVCTPQSNHAECARKAFEAGKHVFMEKPMSTTVSGCDEILAARDKAGKKLFMGFNLRNHSVCKKIKELLESGVIGKPQNITCTDFYSGGPSYFKRWHRLSKNSGGLLVEKGSHSLDLINWFLDSRPVKVGSFGGLNEFAPKKEAASRCRECNLKTECNYYIDAADKELALEKWGHDPETVDMCLYNSGKDTNDNQLSIIEYQNGARASYVESFINRVGETSGRQFMINGPKGQLWAHLNERKITVYPNHSFKKQKGDKVEFKIAEENSSHGGADDQQISYILDCMQHNKDNAILKGEIGKEAVLLARAAELASKESRIVDLINEKVD